MHILVVEDNPAVLEALETVLKHEGYGVATAPNGEEALKALAEAPPDLIILDLWMPVMNGWQFLGRLRQLTGASCSIPVIAISADVRASTGELPVQVFMTKPMDIDRLLDAVKESLAGV